MPEENWRVRKQMPKYEKMKNPESGYQKKNEV